MTVKRFGRERLAQVGLRPAQLSDEAIPFHLVIGQHDVQLRQLASHLGHLPADLFDPGGPLELVHAYPALSLGAQGSNPVRTG